MCDGLAAEGWSVSEHEVPGSWPTPDEYSRTALAGLVSFIEDGSLVVVDGLVGSCVPEILVPHAERLRLVVLVHMPLGDPTHGGPADAGQKEHRVLSAASAVIATSTWTRDWLLGRYALDADRLHVVEPGVDAGPRAVGTATGGRLICVAAVVPGKGHDVLVSALALLDGQDWQCLCVGSRERDPAFASRVENHAREAGLDDRIAFVGTRTRKDLDQLLKGADLLVLPSRGETYGMVVSEALVRGLPCLTTAVGGLPSTLGRDAAGHRPGLMVPPDDPTSLAGALRAWFASGDLRRRMRTSAWERGSCLTDWSATSTQVSRVLAEVAA